MKLSQMLEALPDLQLVSGKADVEFKQLCDDSRQVSDGDLFFCLAADPETVALHARQAAANGAVAVVAPPGLTEEGARVVLATADPRAALADAAHLVFAPTPRILIVGVTGTNGKTTTTLMTAAVLRQAGHRVAVIGTLGTLREDGRREASPNTTPGLLALYRTFQALEAEGTTAVVMEVSSQGVVQHRVRAIPFTAAVWTNLSPEHFELHGDLETYRKIKMRLFSECLQRQAAEGVPAFVNVLNQDDPSYPFFRGACRGGLKTFGLAPGADVRADGIEASFDSSTFRLSAGGREQPVRLALGGDFNVQNALAAAAVGLAFGLELPAIALGLESVQEVPGRFQALGGKARRVLVDYAHTSEGMEKLLGSCRALVHSPERLIVVFGCGGDRDRTKRPRMGRVAAQLADHCFITNDNPRSEDPQQILSDILTGIPEEKRACLTIELDRKAAIREALRAAGPTDLVVIAGKGHEDYQILGANRIHFDDREVVRETLLELGGAN
ncbi:MAG: UDP-N-acetylmuramoyl-L-alanyl-D-glutamate--2,6-diaminopimelate ligase [Candidatus Riflebacteria bacterium]|nr:UDP-N-acetylmuramoyl-L-alanyl-D-glutamate--2,6-diaminopimelate ligase [Candidatus Riflebacteria bacterium]